MNLKELLKRNNLTQREFGEKMGVVQTAVSNWCKGANRPPSSKIREMANVLGVSSEEILNAIEETNRKEDASEVAFAKKGKCICIADMRKSRGYTQEYLASLVGAKQSTVAGWETGRSRPSMKRIISLASVYGVTVDDICACIKK